MTLEELGWKELARRQSGVVSRDQLRAYGADRHYVRTQLRARRWQEVSNTVLVTTTGPLSYEQRLWVGVVQAERPAALAGVTALNLAGLRGWERPFITVLVPKSEDPVRLDGYRFAETRRDIPALTARTAPPRLRVEPAALLFAAYERSERTGCGLLAAVVQQRLTTAPRLREQLAALRPLRRAPLFRLLLDDIEGGAHSMAEVDLGRLCDRFGLRPPDRQAPRRDRNGKRRWLDAEWFLPDGRIVVLEVDGAFHMEVPDWWADMGREREQVIHGREVLRCSSFELRRLPDQIARDLLAIGVPTRRPDERGA
ncbi:MAG TPA: hypothetical protein VFG72_10985 [Marmoricola sp.]|nr:hypothetical protein [Marmoricola sp.]